MLKKLLIIFFVLSISNIAFAKEKQEVQSLGEITVQAKKARNKETSSEQNLQIINFKDEATPTIYTIPDCLKNTSGIDIQTRSILTPKTDVVRIRGLEEKRSIIMVDNRTLNGTGVMGGQFVDWSILSPQNYDSIIISKGAFSAKYGNTIGGIINMTPGAIQDGFNGSFDTMYGSFSTSSTHLGASQKTNDLGIRVKTGYDKTDGYLRNSEADRKNISTEAAYYLPDNGELKLGLRYTEGNYNMPVINDKNKAGYKPSYPEGLGTYLIGPGITFLNNDTNGDKSYYNKKRSEVNLGLKKDFNGIDVQASVYGNNEEREDKIYSYNDGSLILKRKAVPDRSWGWLLKTATIYGRNIFGFGLDSNIQGYGGTKNLYQNNKYMKAVTDGDNQWDIMKYSGAYLDDNIAITKKLELYLGMRYEHYYSKSKTDEITGYNAQGRPNNIYQTKDIYFNKELFLPKAGLVYKANDNISIFTRFAKASRMPDQPAFYWYYGGYRPELDPTTNIVRKDLTYEDATQYEIGSRFVNGQKLSLSLSYYNYEVKNYLRWIFGYAPSRLVYNIDKVNMQGLEFEAEGKITEKFSTFLNMTYQETKKNGDVFDGSNDLTNKIPEIPELKGNLGLKYKTYDKFQGKLSFRYVGERKVPFLQEGSASFLTASNPDGVSLANKSKVELKTMKAFVTTDISMEYTLWKKTTEGALTGSILNVLNEKYEEEYGMPDAGTTYYLGVKINF